MMTIKELLYKNKKQFAIYLIAIFITTPGNLFITLGIANAFKLFEIHTKAEIFKVIIITLLCAIIPVVLQLISRYMRIGFMRDVLVQVRMMAYEKLMNTDVQTFKQKSKEAYQSELTSDINLFETDFFMSLLNITFSLGSFLIGLLVLFWITPVLALTTLLASIILLILTIIFEKPTLESKQKVQEEYANYHSNLSNILRGLETIKLFRVEKRFEQEFESQVSELEKSKKKNFSINNYQADITHWFASTYQIIAYMYAAYLLSQGVIKTPQMVIVINLVGQLSWTMISGFNFANRMKSSIQIYNKITKHEKKEACNIPFKFDNKIQVENLSHAYEQNKVLENVQFTINKNDKVLIYGPSGTGKTTLLDCLTHTITPLEGEVLYDDLNVEKTNELDYWNNVSYARQDHFIFNDSIVNNIILNKEYNQKKLEKVLKQVSLTEWVMGLKERENYLLTNNGNNISGGQRQRISLARALYQDKDILILDEPSASLDDQTAFHVYESILKLDKTIICVSHRHLDILKDRFDMSINLEKKGQIHEAI